MALLVKNLWRALSGEVVWKQFIKFKYLKNKQFVNWIREGAPKNKVTSFIWRTMMKIKYFLGNLKWEVNLGFMVDMSLAFIKGMVGNNSLYVHHFMFFDNNGCNFLKHIYVYHFPNSISNSQLHSREIHLNGPLASQWDQYVLQFWLESTSLSRNDDIMSQDG